VEENERDTVVDLGQLARDILSLRRALVLGMRRALVSLADDPPSGGRGSMWVVAAGMVRSSGLQLPFRAQDDQ
jgi:hypothetical protein